MNGVTWDQRKPGDWLASNGRWYPSSSQPRGWNTLALPPAPGHDTVGSNVVTRAQNSIVAKAMSAASYDPQSAASTPPPVSANRSQGASSASTAPPSSAIVRTGRKVADATATDVSTYKRRIQGSNDGSDSLPSASQGELPPAEKWRDAPPPAGRNASAGQDQPAPPPPVLRRTVKSKVPPSPPQNPAAPPTAANVSGDLGRVLGKARKRIEEAINEASEG